MISQRSPEFLPPKKRWNWRAVGQGRIQNFSVFDHVLLLQCHLFFFLLGFKRPSFVHLATSLNRDSSNLVVFSSKTTFFWFQVPCANDRGLSSRTRVFLSAETMEASPASKVGRLMEKHCGRRYKKNDMVPVSRSQAHNGFCVAFFFGGLKFFQSLNGTLYLGAVKLFCKCMVFFFQGFPM